MAAWADANGYTFDSNKMTLTQDTNISIISEILSNSNDAMTIITVISVLSLTALGGFFFVKKRKEN